MEHEEGRTKSHPHTLIYAYMPPYVRTEGGEGGHVKEGRHLPAA